MNFISGTCNCTLVKFQVDLEKLKTIVNCHCNLCRRMNGSAFSTYAVVLEAGFTLIDGSERLKLHQISTHAQKCFCTHCGTPIYNINPHKYNGLKMLHFGTMPDLRNIIPKFNLFCESKLEWVDHLASIESFAQIKTT